MTKEMPPKRKEKLCLYVPILENALKDSLQCAHCGYMLGIKRKYQEGYSINLCDDCWGK